MSGPVLVLSEKPLMTRTAAVALAGRFHTSELYALHVMRFGAGRFAYPRGLAWSDFPHVRAPTARLDPDHAWIPCRIGEDGATARCRRPAR